MGRLSRSCLTVSLFWFLSLRWGWTGFLGARGRVWIAPAVTPASHLPSSGHIYSSCSSNQSSPDFLTIIVVIRPTPVFCHCEFFSEYLPCLVSQCLFPSSILVFSCLHRRPKLDSSLQPVSLSCLLAPQPTQPWTYL